MLAHPLAPQFIAGKLYRLFVADEPSPSAELLAPLAASLIQNQWELQPTVRMILESRLLLSDETFGRKIRSPVDLAIGLLRTFEGSANSTLLGEDLGRMGMALFFPPNVKGWDGGRTWINASTLLARANGIGRLLRDDKTRFDRRLPGEYLTQRASDPERLLQMFETELLAMPLNAATRGRLLEVGGAERDAARRAVTLLHATAAQAIAQLA